VAGAVRIVHREATVGLARLDRDAAEVDPEVAFEEKEK
jgi:hypothetical protein